MKLLNLIKITLSILFMVCLFPMPYGFYELVRFMAMIGFGYLAYLSLGKEEKNSALIYIILAVLFQPFLKLALGRIIWNFIDVIVAAGLIISMLIPKKTNLNSIDGNN